MLFKTPTKQNVYARVTLIFEEIRRKPEIITVMTNVLTSILDTLNSEKLFVTWHQK